MKRLNLLTTLSAFSFLLLLGIGCQKSNKRDSSVKQGRELIDSLRTVLSKAGEDTNRVKSLNELSQYAGWKKKNYDTATYFAQNALQLARRLNYKKGVAGAFYNLGAIYLYQADYPEALMNFKSGLKMYESIGDKKGMALCNIGLGNYYYGQADYQEALKNFTAALKIDESIGIKKEIGNCYSDIGVVYYSQGDYQEALTNQTAALRIEVSLGDKNGIADCFNSIGAIYSALGNYPEALKNYTSALKKYESIGDKERIANGYNNVGNIYFFQGNDPEALKNYTTALKIRASMRNKNGIGASYSNIGLIHSDQGNYPEALKNYMAALKIAESIGDKSGIATCYSNIGLIYSNQGNYMGALKNYMSALKIDESIGDKNGIAICYSNIGTVCIGLKKAKEGKVWLQKSVTLSKAIGAKEAIKDSYFGLSQADSALGDYKSAFKNYKMSIAYQDSLKNEENTKKITQIGMQYEFDKKQLADSLKNVQVRKLAAEKLGKQKTYTALGAGLAFLLLGFSFFIFRNNKKLDKEKKKSESLLLNILPVEVAEELKEKGHADAKQFDEVSVLFTDFVHFTQTSAQLTPKQIIKELNECFTAFDNIIERNGLEKIKTIGDAYMAVCGLPVSDPRHAQRTVQAALEIRDFITERKKRNEGAFEIRIGVNSGSVVAGIVGVKKFAYDIWGDTVNTASRMESNGEPGKVNISDTTYQLVKNDFECTYRGKIMAKGKGEVDMYFVSGQWTVES